MKNKLSLVLISISLVALPNLSLAQTNASAIKSTIKSEIDAQKAALKNSVEEAKQNATDKIKTQIDQFVQNIINRFDAATARLGKLADRIDSRMAKMEAQKIDVSKAKSLMVVARVKLETARISVISISLPADVASSTVSSTIASLREDFKIVKTQIEKAKTDIKAAQAALVDVVNSLKPGDEKLKKNSLATTTATTTNQ